MPALKVYTLGNHGFVSSEVGDTVGAGPHRQARVLIVAASKWAAIELAEETPGAPVPTASDTEFRVAMGTDVDALAEAGMFSEPQILAMAQFVRAGSPVARIAPDGFAVIGEFAGDRHDRRFVTKEN